jgi:uncharacterized protein (DUF2126 family)
MFLPQASLNISGSLFLTSTGERNRKEPVLLYDDPSTQNTNDPVPRRALQTDSSTALTSPLRFGFPVMAINDLSWLPETENLFNIFT